MIQKPGHAVRIAQQALENLDPPITGATHRIVRETESAFIVEYPLLVGGGDVSQRTEVVVSKFVPKVELLMRVSDDPAARHVEEPRLLWPRRIALFICRARRG
ncbi:MAG: hypothetical protein M9935_01010 [Kiritimatiellae bacterium]|nr:hypothetical protein [Kiritimatiellia bacterium]